MMITAIMEIRSVASNIRPMRPSGCLQIPYLFHLELFVPTVPPKL
jgi:hypothetical protein